MGVTPFDTILSMAGKKTDTLVSAELAWKPVVIAVFLACAAVSVALVSGVTSRGLFQFVGIVACSALTLSNVVHLLADGTTFGMIPVSIVSLGFAGAAAGSVPVAAAGLVVAVVLVAGFVLLRASYSRHPRVSPGATLVVLGCAVEDGRPSKTLELRLRRAAGILSACPDANVVVTGGPVAGINLTEADVMAQWLTEHGVEPTRVFLERQAKNTDENLAKSAQFIEELGLSKEIVVVSSDYHLWRARHAARKLTPTLVIETAAAPTPAISRLQQWSREVLVVIKELLVQ